MSLSCAGLAASWVIRDLRSFSSSIIFEASKFLGWYLCRDFSSGVSSVLLATFKVDLRQADLSLICGCRSEENVRN